ncbi:MAG: hypothetical protein KH135_02175 [Firmicutes bacterium]|nr:hypothetical protein [Bacillota bacterium]
MKKALSTSEMLENRKSRLKKLFGLKESVVTRDARMIRLLKLLENKEKNMQQENDKLNRDYGEILHLRKKLFKNEEIEKSFEEEMGITINHFISHYLFRKENRYERWGLTNVPRTNEMKEKYPLEQEPVVRDTYRFCQDGGEMKEIHNPTIIQLIDFLEHKLSSNYFLREYKKYLSLCERYQINVNRKPDMLDMLSGYMGFASRKEFNTWFLQELGTTPTTFIEQYAEKGFINDVGIWGLVSSPDKDKIEGVETYRFTPSGNRIVDTKNQTPLVHYVEQKRREEEVFFQMLKEQKEVANEEEIEKYTFQFPTVDTLDLNFQVPANIIKYYPTLATLYGKMDNILELQMYGLSLEEVNIYLYQKFLANDAALLKTENYFELAKQEKVALEYLTICLEKKQIRDLEKQGEKLLQTLRQAQIQSENEKTEGAKQKKIQIGQNSQLALA